MQRISIFLTLLVLLLFVAACTDRDDNAVTATQSQAGEVSYALIPESILTPDSVDSRIGTLEFFDGYPSA
ncbi:MAG: hypothetical protein ACO22K_13720, partial [Woeseiaceae bacterium]